MKYLVQRIAEHLIAYGNCSTSEIAQALGETASRVGDAIKSERQRARWGIERLGYATNYKGGGHPPSIWTISATKYRQYLNERRDMPWLAKRLLKTAPTKPAPRAKASVKIPKERIVPLSERPVYTGPILTRWQPSSPYYKDRK